MGALHPGHVSLIEASRQECDLTVCSIFVNPTQFNDKADLERYPRTPEKDAEVLKKAGCDVLFMPGVTEIYPSEAKPVFDFGRLDKTLEGFYRPGHFNGMAQVVKRFFEIVVPDKAYFGSKDYQQMLIVKALVVQMHAPIRIVSCPIVRENDGLAMSSRNMLLNPEERKSASAIPAIMQKARQVAEQYGVVAAKQFINGEVARMKNTRLEYYEICDTETLEELGSLKNSGKNISLIALFIGKIRLIDNLVF